MTEDHRHDPPERVNHAYVLGPGEQAPPSISPPLSEEAARHDHILTTWARERGGHEDLNRGDNYTSVKSGHRQTQLRVLAKDAHPDAQSAFSEAMGMVSDLQGHGYSVGVTSRIGAAVSTGPDQEPAGWRALLDLSLLHPPGKGH